MANKINNICKAANCNNWSKKNKDYCNIHKYAGNGKTKTDYGTKTTYKYKECHTGNVLIGEPQGISIYAGGSSRSGGWWRMFPYPDLAIGPSEIVSKKGPAPLDKRWAGTKSSKWIAEELPIVLSLDFPDYGIPKGVDGNPLPREFWLDLVDDIIDRDIKTISTQCMGGHGRTGIQVAILLYLLTPKEDRQWTSLAELLAYIHDIYCDQAVEGDSQAKYIAEVCGIEEGDYKLHHSRATGGNWAGGDWYGYGNNYKTQSPKKKKESAMKLLDGKEWCRACGQWTKMSDYNKDEKKCKGCIGSDGEYQCDTCGTKFNWDIQHCTTCDVGLVSEVHDTTNSKYLDNDIDYYGF